MSENKEYVNDSFTKVDDDVNLEINNLNLSCMTSRNNKFNLDSEGNLTVKSINVLEGNTLEMQDIFNVVYPIGSIYMTMNSGDPSTLFGGSWSRIAKGRTLVGVDEEDTDFDVSEKIGGSKEVTLKLNQIPNHYHDGLLWGGISGNPVSGNAGTENHLVELKWFKALGDNPFTTGRAGGGKSHNNLQPYITCYIWQRIA